MPDYYPAGYREDEEMYVYDQCCDNCALHGSYLCPLELPADEKSEKYREVKKRRQEDAVMNGDDIAWCVNWKSQSRRQRW